MHSLDLPLSTNLNINTLLSTFISDIEGHGSGSLVTPDNLVDEVKENFSDVTHSHQPSSPLRLTNSDLGTKGHLLSEFIKRQGDNPQLEKIDLDRYSMPESKWLFQFTATCRCLTLLDLNASKLRKAARYLAQSITSWGDNPPLRYLYLSNCSIPEQVWPELLQSLSSCKHLSRLILSHNKIREAARYLAQSITSWGDNPPLRDLYLSNCSIPEQVWPELLQSLSSCKQLSYLDLSGNNTIGEAARDLAQSIAPSGADSPLQHLGF